MKKFDISSFGEILIDFTAINSTDRLFEQNPGGAPGNMLVAATKLGCKTAFIGKAGKDMHGEFLKNTLLNENVDTKGFVLDDKYFTTLAFVNINEFKERSFSFARKPGADTQMNISEVNFDIIKESKIFHIGSLSLTDNPSKDTTYECIKFAKENNIIISYDPNYRASLWSSEEDACIAMRSIIPDVMKISDEETLLLTGTSDCLDAANILLSRGVKIVVVTLGEKGCLVATNNNHKVVKGYKSNLVDTTGAGDSFWGAFLSKLTSYNSIEEIGFDKLLEFADFANATASLCIEKRGAILAMPSLNDVLNRMKLG